MFCTTLGVPRPHGCAVTSMWSQLRSQLVGWEINLQEKCNCGLQNFCSRILQNVDKNSEFQGWQILLWFLQLNPHLSYQLQLTRYFTYGFVHVMILNMIMRYIDLLITYVSFKIFSNIEIDEYIVSTDYIWDFRIFIFLYSLQQTDMLWLSS